MLLSSAILKHIDMQQFSLAVSLYELNEESIIDLLSKKTE